MEVALTQHAVKDEVGFGICLVRPKTNVIISSATPQALQIHPLIRHEFSFTGPFHGAYASVHIP